MTATSKMDTGFGVGWHQAAKHLHMDGRALINGERVQALNGDSFAKHSPVDGRMLSLVAKGQAADVDMAVRAARASFEAGGWSRQSPAVRKRVLLRFAERISQAQDELALLETLDMGKPIQFSRDLDVVASANCMAWYAEAADKVYGELAPTAFDTRAWISREAMGVIGVIVPWNYPLLMACWKIAPALAAGNSVVLKPSEKSPFTALRLAELALEAGVPPGVLNVVPGWGHEAGEALALHPDVDAIGFTGSTGTGRRMLEYASRSNLKRIYNELGGKSACIVFSDFEDLETAAQTVVAAMFFNQGQSCNAPSRLLVDASIADEFTQRVVALAASYQPADPLLESTVFGAMVDAPHLDRVMGYIHRAEETGAHLRCGGLTALGDQGGCYIKPTVFDGVDPDMEIAREEVFGPVLSVLRFTTEEEVLRIANDSPYGLQAGVWSSHLDRAHRVARGLRAGTVHINCYDEDDMTVPFGGVKQSGNGRDKSLHALEKYTELKTTWLRLRM